MKEIENTIESLRELSGKRINKIELLLGNGNNERGKEIMASLLETFTSKKFLSVEIGRLVNRDRHTIHKWYKRYNVKPIKYEGIKKSIIILFLHTLLV